RDTAKAPAPRARTGSGHPADRLGGTRGRRPALPRCGSRVGSGGRVADRMPISRGSAWGAPGRLPPDGVVVHSDGEASALVERHRRAGEPVPAIGLLGGDLWRTLGGLGRLDITFPIDAVEARVDG